MEVGEVLKLLRCSSFEEALARFRARTAHEAIVKLVERGSWRTGVGCTYLGLRTLQGLRETT